MKIGYPKFNLLLVISRLCTEIVPRDYASDNVLELPRKMTTDAFVVLVIEGCSKGKRYLCNVGKMHKICLLFVGYMLLGNRHLHAEG